MDSSARVSVGGSLSWLDLSDPLVEPVAVEGIGTVPSSEQGTDPIGGARHGMSTAVALRAHLVEAVQHSKLRCAGTHIGRGELSSTSN